MSSTHSPQQPGWGLTVPACDCVLQAWLWRQQALVQQGPAVQVCHLRVRAPVRVRVRAAALVLAQQTPPARPLTS
jgi:hypothetical protein